VKVVADSHAIVWYLQGSERSAVAEQALIESEMTEGLVVSVATVSISGMSPRPPKRLRQPSATIRTMLDASTAVAFEPMTVAIGDATTSIPRDLLKDP
jgi:PIN domain nuclease of toxin-antitoxin system